MGKGQVLVGDSYPETHFLNVHPATLMLHFGTLSKIPALLSEEECHVKGIVEEEDCFPSLITFRLKYRIL